MPYVGLYLRDITFISENEDYVDKELINFQKMRLFADVVEEIETLQLQTFNLQEVEEPIVQFLNNLKVLGEKELYKISLEREPRGS